MRGWGPVRRAYRRKRNRAADAYILSYPKCGRTWLRLMLGHALASHHGLLTGDHALHPEALGEVDALASLVPGLPRVRFKHDDNPHYRTPRELVPLKDEYADRPVVLLVRDPRDTVVSLYHQMTKRETRWRYTGSLADYIRFERGSFTTMLRYYNLWADRPSDPLRFMRMRYEDLHEDPGRELARLLEFIGIEGVTQATLDSAVAFASFDNMRKLETAAPAQGSSKPSSARLAGGHADRPETLKTRQGKVGSYRDELPPDLVAWVDAEVRDGLNPVYGYR